MMHKTLRPRDDIDRLYMSRKEGRRGLANIKDCVDTAIQQLKKEQRNFNYPYLPTPPLG